MKYEQTIQPNLNPYIWSGGKMITDWLAWCMGYVNSAYSNTQKDGRDLVVVSSAPSAWKGWLASKFQHKDQNFPAGVYVPVWFEYWGTVNGEYGNWGHVAIYKDGKIWSSPISHKATADTWTSIAQVEAKYKCKFVGWTEDVAGTRVIAPAIAPAPTTGGTTVARELVTKDDVDLIRQVSSENKGWPYDEVHSGKFDAKELAFWAGKPIRDLIQGAWNESAAWRERRSAALAYYATKAANDKALADAQKQAKDFGDANIRLSTHVTELEALQKPVEPQTPSNYVNIDDLSIADLLAQIFRKLKKVK